MSEHHPWSELLAKMPAERCKCIKEDADALHREYTLSEIRRQAGLTQCQMAEKLNVSQPAYASFEKGSNLRVGTLQKIASALGGKLSLSFLLNGDNFVLDFGAPNDEVGEDMIEQKISRRELGNVFSVSEDVVENWENGNTIIDIEELLLYAKICKIDLMDILVITE